MEKIINQKSFNYFIWTPLDSSNYLTPVSLTPGGKFTAGFIDTAVSIHHWSH
jgi:hypothetical protein